MILQISYNSIRTVYVDPERIYLFVRKNLSLPEIVISDTISGPIIVLSINCTQ